MTPSALKLRVGRYKIQAATVAWVNAVVGKGGTVSVTQRRLVDDLLRALNRSVGLASFVDIRLACMESAVAAYTTLLLNLTPTKHADPAFIVWRGVAMNGVNQYDDWGLIPIAYASKISASSLRVAHQEQTNSADGAGTGVAVGSAQDALKNMELYPRLNTNQIGAKLNSTFITGPTNTNSRRMVGGQREGSTYTFDAGGIDLGTASPLTPGNTLSNVTTFIGARNNAGTPDSFRLGIVGASYVSRPFSEMEKLTVANIFDAYFASAALLVDPNVFVSSVAFGGIPIGDDSDPGSEDEPVLTISRGLFGLPPSGTLHINGNPASKPTYAATSEISIAEAAVIEAIDSRGAIVAGYGTFRIAQIGPTGGETVTIRKGVLDASLNTVGEATHGLELLTVSTPYSVVLDDIELGGQASSGFALRNSAVGLKANLSLTDSDLVGGVADTRGNIDIRDIVSGVIEIDGGSNDVPAAILGGFGPVVLHARTADVSATITDYSASITADPDIFGTTAVGISLTNIPATFDGVTCAASSPIPAEDNGPQCHMVAISQGRLTDTYQFPISGSRMTNLSGFRNTFFGGSFARMGDDNSDRSLAADCEMSNFDDFEGGEAFADGGGHCIWPVNCLRPHVFNFTRIRKGAIGLVDKSNWDGLFEDGELEDMTSGYIINKASLRSIYRRIICRAHAGWAGTMISFSVGDNNDAGVWGDGTFEDCTFIVDGALNVPLVVCPAGAGFAMTRCHFELISGSIATHKFHVGGVNYDSFAAFDVVFPGNTANFA